MKMLLKIYCGERLPAQMFRNALVLLVAAVLMTGFWAATTPLVSAAPVNATEMLEANIPSKKSLANASKSDVLAAVTAAVKSSATNIGRFVKLAAQAHSGHTNDIVSAAIRALGRNPDCQLIVDAAEAGIEANPDAAASIVEAALRIAPACRGQIENIGTRGEGRGGEDGEGNFANAPANQNPPPGSVGGGSAGQAGQCQVCHRDGQGRRRTITISCNALPAHIGHGDTEGACPVTPTQNP